MIIKFEVHVPEREYHQTMEITLPDYYNSREVVKDLEKVLDYHEMRYEKQKSKKNDKILG